MNATLFHIPTLELIRKLGNQKTEKNFDLLLEFFYDKNLIIELKREVVSSIGRQENNDRIYEFLNKEAFEKHYMDVIYQMFRTTLYKSQDDKRFAILCDKMLNFYDNEFMIKMHEYHLYRKTKNTNKSYKNNFTKPSLLVGDNRITLSNIDDGAIQLVFTSPPYYNARIYSDYINYKTYLDMMKETLLQCYRILEDGRFIIINVSPVISKRAGREFESIRYPIHFDFHRILVESGFYFIDEIIWIKPEYSVPNRVAGYLQSKKPLGYKPNCITESVMVYRKNSPFLLDKNIKQYDKALKNDDEIDSTNCWYITPKSDKNHPAVFPEELCQKVLKYYSYVGDVVCDPFAGSGTFGKVAINMGRIPILCEQNLSYVEKLKQKGFYEI